MKYFLAFLAIFFIVCLITPFLIKIGVKLSFVDIPTKRKNHKIAIPLTGGIGIFIGFFLGYLFFMKSFDKSFFYLILASSLVFFIGLVDDWYKSKHKEFSAFPRLIVHIFAAILIYKSGIVFSGFTNPFSHQYIVLPTFLKFLLSITWIVGVTTVINWSDGLDGLSGSLSAISASTLFIVALVKHQGDSAMMAILLLAALLGFLKYNRFPAKIFIGDSGANFAGFILAIIALDGAFKQATLISLVIPILALGVPIFDNIYVVIRRILTGRPIYVADATQLHHRLLSTGLNAKQTLTFILLISVCLNLFSIIILLLKI